MEGSRESYNETRQFLDRQIQEYEKQLEEAEMRRAEFERQYLGLLPGDVNYSQRLLSAQRGLREIDFKIQQAQSARNALAAQLASVPKTIPGPMLSSPAGAPRFDPSTTLGRIEVLERQITDSLARGYTEQHPDIVSARQTIERLKKQHQEELKAGGGSGQAEDEHGTANPVYVDLRSRLFDMDSQIASLRAQRSQQQMELNELESRASTMPGVEAERAKLNRDYNVLKAKYEELLRSREETRVASDLESKTDKVQFRIVDPPQVPSKPVAPNRPLLLAAVMAVGLGVGVGLAFVLSQIHTVYVTVANLKSSFANMPVLGSISAITNEQQRAQARLRLGVFAFCCLGLAGVFVALLVLELSRQVPTI